MEHSEPETPAEIQEQFVRIFHRNMTREERRCFFFSDDQKDLVAEADTEAPEIPLAGIVRIPGK